ncbi:FAD binding domain-containing protein [Hirsutella rhossiliensis]|uniref:FAD binding domain-containing protein n=1 Tax=Hirsutella rhossiliensis TaxID=111463 RepID=A0A9P8SMB1_9HYPO|nr:FAD binding domain-containing protein [Hirsutella rhossiliensis]KAH0967816.1 FAD binding domain-containing protein [Hirsutella rhossiliensis]
MENFKVLIIGGSVAGLTLANCLERLEISYEILEQSDDICPQLGIFDSVERVIEPLELARICFPDGYFFRTTYPSIIRDHLGYPLSFLERQKFLEILYNKLVYKDRVHTGQTVLSIEDLGSHVVARTADREYSGHLVVGADGVHSIVRAEIWNQANQAKPGAIADSEKSALRIEYACVYGISSGVPGVQDGVQLSLLDHGVTIHVFSGRNTKVFWFVILKIERYCYGDRPKFDTQDAREICESLKTKKIDSTLTFGDVWISCDIFAMTPLEEGYFKTWHFGRLMCIGDAVRKMAPNFGQGANMAIEDASALANALWKGDLGKGMAETRAMEDIVRPLIASRLASTKNACRRSEFLARLQAGDGMVKRLFARYIFPALHDIPSGSSAAILKGAERLEFVDLPARAKLQHAGWTLAKSLGWLVGRRRILFLACMGALFMSWASDWVTTFVYVDAAERSLHEDQPW